MKTPAEILASLSVTEAICAAATPAPWGSSAGNPMIDLLTHARTALPELTGIVRELLAENERLRRIPALLNPPAPAPAPVDVEGILLKLRDEYLGETDGNADINREVVKALNKAIRRLAAARKEAQCKSQT